MEARFNVRGKVQGVFFRKSFVYWLELNGLSGGATNNSEDRNLVHCTIIGEKEIIFKIKDQLQGRSFNNVGARVEAVDDFEHHIPLENHQAKTSSSPSKLPPGIKLRVESQLR